MKWIGIDTGGTFTDFVLIDFAAARVIVDKRATDPAAPTRAVLDGLDALTGGRPEAGSAVGRLALGTTLATNAVLEGKTARTGMITTEGFRDILELARQRRPHLYDLEVAKPTPPVPRAFRLEVAERLDETGAVVTPLDEAAVGAAAQALRDAGAQAVAICFLHAYADPTHEQRARALVRAVWPDAYVSVSSEVLAEMREFERFATTAVNAGLMPVIDRALAALETETAHRGLGAALRVMQSNGGLASPAAVRRTPINTFISGPAGGVIAAAALGARHGRTELISFDMGGTSTDVCLVRDGRPTVTNAREIGGWPVRAAGLDIHTIGAGGGSLAWVDEGGLLKVGPASAGAHPGPAAYGRGGTDATVTDADLVLGRLDPRIPLGGRIPLDPARAHEAIAALGRRIGRAPIETAAGIVEVVTVAMVGAVRLISIGCGEDPRRTTLVAFGGAGPLHAAAVAAELGIPQILVPPHPGLVSAFGLTEADLRGDFSLTRLVPAEPASVPAVNAGLTALAARGDAWLTGETAATTDAVAVWRADLRYRGQSFELSVPLPGGAVDAAAMRELARAFHHRHHAVYGHQLPDQPVELVTLRLALTVPRPTLPGLAAPPPVADDPGDLDAALTAARTATRPVWFADGGFHPTPVYRRERLPRTVALTGPAVIAQMDATVCVPPGAHWHVASDGAILIALADRPPEDDHHHPRPHDEPGR